MNKTTVLPIVKGILLWATTLSTILFILSVDSISLKAFIMWLVVVVFSIDICRICITKKEFIILSGNAIISKYLSKFFEEDEE